MSRRPAVMSWSSGKDSTMALHAVRQDPLLEVVALFSTFNESAGRVAIHGTRREIAQAQASALGLPLVEVGLPQPCTNEVYQDRMAEAVGRLKDEGVEDWVFGDLFLQDVRAYREAQLTAQGLRAHFPLWGRDTAALARDMLSAGVDAHVVTLDPKLLDPSLCGTRFDAAFLDALPDVIDPCGERGEFHTVVANGPGFAYPLRLDRGITVERSGFVYTDFSLLNEPQPASIQETAM